MDPGGGGSGHSRGVLLEVPHPGETACSTSCSVFGTVVKFPTVSTVSYSDPPHCAVAMQIHLVDPDGRVVQDLWSSKRLTVEVLLDGPEATTTAAAPPEVVPVYHNVQAVPTMCAFPTGRTDI